MSNKIKTVTSDFICLECGNIIPISRIEGRQRKDYHHKKLYCFECNKKVTHAELKEWDIMKKLLEFKGQKNKEEEKVYSLLLKRNRRA